MENGTIGKFLQIAALTMVALALISLMWIFFNKTSQALDSAEGKLDSMNIMIEESDYTKYDGAIITGADVIAAVKYFQNGEPLCIKVATSGGDVTFGYTDSTLSTPVGTQETSTILANCQKKGSANYINPSAKYQGKVERNETDNTIWGIMFTYATN